MNVGRTPLPFPALLCPAILSLLLPVSSTVAHPISVTQTFVYVTREKIAVKMEVFVEDLFLFHNLKPNDQDFLEPDVIEQGIEKHRGFLLKRFVIRDSDGEQLVGRSGEVQRFEMPSEGLPLAELMSHKLTFTMDYALDTAPEFLTFSQHLVDDRLLVPAEMQLTVKQENAGLPHQQMLYPNTPQTVRFSWDNPPLSTDASEEQWEDWYQQQKEETLGITSYSSVYSFLYINDREVRHEILIPLLTLEESVLIARADDNFLEVAEQDLAAEQIKAYFCAGNPVEIDGQVVEPVVDRLDFYGLDFRDFARRAERRRVSMANARVGIILSYRTKDTPQEVQVSWDRFNRFIWTINMIIYAFVETQKVTLSRIGAQNVYHWENPGRPALPRLEPIAVELLPRAVWNLPLISLACMTFLPIVLCVASIKSSLRRFRVPLILLVVGVAVIAWPYGRIRVPGPLASAPQLNEEQAAEIFTALHQNVYRAFESRDEEEIYDALAMSVDGPLLKQLYLEIRRGLEVQEQGGAVSRIGKVNLVEGRRTALDARDAASRTQGFGFDAKWTVAGTVEHWGHIHARTNQYQAKFDVEPRDGKWKITALDVEEEQRVSFETTLRGL